MKLYWGPHTCAIGTHILLEEVGAVYETEKIDVNGLFPSNPDAEARVIEVIEYVEGTVHGQGFARIFKPAKLEPQDLLHGKVMARLAWENRLSRRKGPQWYKRHL